MKKKICAVRNIFLFLLGFLALIFSSPVNVFAVDLAVGSNGESTASPYAVSSDQDWDSVYVAKNSGSLGVINQSDGLFRHLNNMYVGFTNPSTGTYNQTGGTNSGGSFFTFIGYTGGTGTYNLDGGTFSSRQILVGYSGGIGTFSQTDGYWSTSGSQPAFRVGDGGTGTYNQSGGTNYTSTFSIGSGGTGTVNLSGGTLSATNMDFGNNGTGTFNHDQGTNSVSNIITLGWKEATSKGTYNLNGGDVSANYLYVGNYGTGNLNQTGGSFTVGDASGGPVYIGNMAGSNGTYTAGGGTFSAKDIYVGYNGTGTLDVTSAAAQITVSGTLQFGANGHFSAVPGTVIHMTGTQFKNFSTHPENLAGLNNATFIYDPLSSGVYDFFEVGGANMGHSTPDGFSSNFALEGLQIGGTNWLNLSLGDDVDNQADGAGNEVLYVKSLTLGAGSSLYLNGYDLFYESFLNHNGGFNNVFFGTDGQMLQVTPEPVSAALFLLGSGVLALRNFRKKRF